MRPKAGGPGKPRGRHLHHTISSRLLLGIGREWSALWWGPLRCEADPVESHLPRRSPARRRVSPASATDVDHRRPRGRF